MNIKSQKGFAGTDVIVAILIITVFAGIIVSLYNNYTIASREIERKAKATQYAVDVIEEIKQNSSLYFNTENANKEEIIVCDNEEIEEDKAYTKTVKIKDYATINKEAEIGYVKEVQVVLNYKSGKEVRSIELNTVIAKES